MIETSDRAVGLGDLAPKDRSRRRRRRVGRGHGSGRGGPSGRGTKGAQARAGYSRMRDHIGGATPLTRRVAKRGFRNPFRVEHRPVNLDRLNAFPDGAEVNPEALEGRGLSDGRRPIAILGKGALERKLTVKAHRFSAAARAAIEAKGGTAEVVPWRASARTATA